MKTKICRARRRSALVCFICLLFSSAVVARGVWMHWVAGNNGLVIFGTLVALVLSLLLFVTARWFVTAHIDPHGSRGLLSQMVSQKVVPRLGEAGFQTMPIDPDRATRADVDLHRQRADGGYDLVMIQFAKHGSPAFSCQIAVAPAVGTTGWQGEEIAAADARVYEMTHRGDVLYQPITMLGRVFWGLRGFTWRLKVDASAADVGRMYAVFVDRMEDLERWFASGVPGRHIKQMILSRPASPQAGRP